MIMFGWYGFYYNVALSQLCLHLQVEDLEQDNSGNGTAIENETKIVAKDGKYLSSCASF